MLLDRLILGVRDKAAKARLFREKECSLIKAIESLQISEVTCEQLTIIRGKEKEAVNAVSEKAKRRPAENTVRIKQLISGKQSCRYCGGKRHKERQQCPAYGKFCRKCGKSNHFQLVCRAQPSNKQLHVVTTEQSGDESDDSLYQLEEVGAINHR